MFSTCVAFDVSHVLHSLHVGLTSVHFILFKNESSILYPYCTSVEIFQQAQKLVCIAMWNAQEDVAGAILTYSFISEKQGRNTTAC